MKRLFWSLSMAALLALASCSMETSVSVEKPIIEPPVPSDNVDSEISLVIPGGFSVMSTRALTAAQESAVENASVLVFDGDGLLVEIVDIESAKIKSTGERQVTLNMKLPVGSYKLAVVANADVSGGVGESYEDVMAGIVESVEGGLFVGAGDNSIPMWGETSGAVEITKSSKFDIDLTRSVARVDVGVGQYVDGAWDDKGIPFTITEVYLMRAPSAYRVVPGADEFAGDEPSLPEPEPDIISVDDSVEGFKFTEGIVNGKYMAQQIYAPEAVIIDGIHTEQMAVVVGGKYRDSETVTYYRLNFATGAGELLNVLRNHLYRFQIASVVGMGYEYPETAYNAVGESKMIATVLAWDEDLFGDVPIFGDMYMDTDVDEAVIGAVPDLMKEVTVSTNLYDFGVYVGGGALPIMTASAAQAAGTAGQSVSVGDFSYTLKKVAASETNWTLTVNANSYNIGASGSARSASLTLKGGPDDVVTADVAISQSMGTLVWAGSNLADNGVFTVNPTDDGALFQWGRNEAYSIAGQSPYPTSIAEPEAWTANPQTGEKAAADPCPEGWRVPTFKEIADLIDTTTNSGAVGDDTSAGYTNPVSPWVTGVGNGISFSPTSGTDTGKTLTFVNAGGLNTSGSPIYHGTYVYLWAATSTNETNNSYFLRFYADRPMGMVSNTGRRYAFSVRCVRNAGGSAIAGQTVTVTNPTGGTVNLNSSSVAAGQLAQATAVPGPGMLFSGWSATGVTLSSTTANPLTFTMPEGPVTLTANFTAKPRRISVAYPAGSTGISVRASGAAIGTQMTAAGVAVASPTQNTTYVVRYEYSSDYTLVGWKVTHEGTDVVAPGVTINVVPPYQFTMPSYPVTITPDIRTMASLGLAHSPNDVAITLSHGTTVWAHANLTGVGTFASVPTDPGCYFQWGYLYGANNSTVIAGPAVTEDRNVRTSGPNTNASAWTAVAATGVKAAADPCPTGWRVPTGQEYADLIDATTWTVESRNYVTGKMNGAYTSWTRATSPSPGCYFTPVHGDTGKTLYIPYAGWRNYTGDMIYRTNNTTGSALYWSSTANPTDNTRAWIITTENYGLSMQPSGIKLTPYSVRCVRSGSGGVPLSAIPSEGDSDPWGDGGQNNL